MSEIRLAREIFQPGGLIHGARLSDLPSLIENGIQIGMLSGNKNPTAPNHVCFALLSSRHSVSKRYQQAEHYGPPNNAWHDYKPTVGIVIPQASLNGHFSRLFAVGSYFWNRQLRLMFARDFNLKPEDQTVFGVPIKINYSQVHGDEVRYDPGDNEPSPFLPNLWGGLVIEEDDLAEFQSMRRNISLEIPVFNPQIELIA
ncbi:hypothetical protein HY025_01215 [Candidatus Daviesbacteria bacterium]|nr:hypothetical protein [Candidatus Daviesbacteria bacterium]